MAFLKPPKMISTFNNIANRFLAKHDDFRTAKQAELFQRTDPKLDGDDCLHDCENCTVKYPSKFSIDEVDHLYGAIKGWSRHVLVATGKADWVRDVEDEEGSVMEAIGKHKDGINKGKLMLSASNIPTPEHHDSQGPYGPDRPTRILLLPSFQWIEGVTPNLVPELIQSVINTAPTNTTPIEAPTAAANGAGTNGSKTNGTTNGASHTEDPLPSLASLQVSSSDLPAGLSLSSCPHKYLILLCSQGTRDARCGQTAPLLRKELERQLRPLGLYRDLTDERPGGVGIYFISHVGGHKYSANMLIYRKADVRRTVAEQMENGTTASNGTGGKQKDVAEGEAAQCIWLARVRPEDCENIIRYTVLQGKVVKPERQLRGGFDREKGLVSW